MKKFRVMEIQTVVVEFEVQADSHDQAQDKVRSGEHGEPTRTKVVDCEYESELISDDGDNPTKGVVDCPNDKVTIFDEIELERRLGN